ncbi:unnamed protein product [Scytosiphon promiscuus]
MLLRLEGPEALAEVFVSLASCETPQLARFLGRQIKSRRARIVAMEVATLLPTASLAPKIIPVLLYAFFCRVALPSALDLPKNPSPCLQSCAGRGYASRGSSRRTFDAALSIARSVACPCVMTSK